MRQIHHALLCSKAGWDLHEQIFREYTLRQGRVVVKGRTSARDPRSILRADYVLCHKANIPLAVVEAKDNLPQHWRWHGPGH